MLRLASKACERKGEVQGFRTKSMSRSTCLRIRHCKRRKREEEEGREDSIGKQGKRCKE